MEEGVGVAALKKTREKLGTDYVTSISGGKETNKDSPSNGERTGNSPS